MRQFNFQEAHSRLEGCTLQTEQFCCAARAANSSVGFPQSFQDRFTLDFPEIETPGLLRFPWRFVPFVAISVPQLAH